MDKNNKRKMDLEDELLEPDDYHKKHGMWVPKKSETRKQIDKVIEEINKKFPGKIKRGE